MKKRINFLLLIPLLFLFTGTAKKTDKDSENSKESSAQQRPRVQNYPLKTAAYWTSPTMDPTEVVNLAKHDIVVADLENKFNNRQSLLALRQLNPNIIILAYSNPMEIWLRYYSSRPWQNQVIKEITTKRPQWLLTTVTTSGPREVGSATFWRGMTMLNMSVACPKVNGETYSEWMAEKLRKEILSDKEAFDGYFMDNATVDVAWMYRDANRKIDINHDGKPDKDQYVDGMWRAGIEGFLDDIHSSGSKHQGFWGWLKSLFSKSDYLIVSNKGDLFLLKYVKGKLFENFPLDYVGSKWAGGWDASINNASKTGPYTIIQANRGNLDFVLASTLLIDNAHIAIGQDDFGVFDELNLVTGRPLGRMRRNGDTFTREYEHVSVFVDPLNKIGTITRK